MKKHLLLIAFAFISVTLHAQYLNITDFYFTYAPNGTALPDTGLMPGADLNFQFEFVNNLANGQDIQSGDKISFAWHTTGSSIVDTLGTHSWPAPLPNGQSASLYAHSNVTLPADSCFSWEVCLWPLYNPYSPNIDPQKGRHCVTFKTTGCKTGTTSHLAPTVNEQMSNFYVADRSLHFKFPNNEGTNKVELFNLAGKKVFSKYVSDQGVVNILDGIPGGIFILKASDGNSEVTKKVFIR